MKRRTKIWLLVGIAAIAACFAIVIFLAQGMISGAGDPYNPSSLNAGEAEYVDGILLVNSRCRLPRSYVPEDLVTLKEQPDRVFGVTQGDIMLDADVYRAMNSMFEAAAQDGVTGFLVSSGYRTWEQQQALYESEEDVAVPPGASEHQTGLAFDLSAIDSDIQFADTEEAEWITAHGDEYGFILRYPYPPEKIAITGVSYEPWHFRFVGKDAATAMRYSGLVLEELIALKKTGTQNTAIDRGETY